MRKWCPILFVLALSGCDLLGEEATVLSEGEASEAITKRLTTLGYAPTATDHAITGLEVCDPKTGACETVTFTLDGWDNGQRVGFEYLSDEDPDFAMVSGFRYSFWPDALQDAVKTKLTGDVILVIRKVAHETKDLAKGHLDNAVDARLNEYGIGK